MSKSMFTYGLRIGLGSTLILSALAAIDRSSASAQITAEISTDTVINPNPANQNQLNITGGIQVGQNLFHGFQQFNVNAGQGANFQAAPTVQNVLGRVMGGQASVINGQLQVSGAAANLFLINPAGVLFGPNVQLNLPGNFTATTANGIGFANGWFNANGLNDYTKLTGAPNQFAFTTAQPGAIVNMGNLQLGAGNTLTLLGGRLINTGTLQVPGGTVTIAAVPGEQLVRITLPGGLLSVDLPLAVKNSVGAADTAPMNLAELVTSVGDLENATDVTIVDGKIQLTGSDATVADQGGITLIAGKVDVQGEQGGKIQITGDRLGLFGARLNASGQQAGGTILVGGEYQGQGDLPNARRTYVDRQTVIQADARTQGDGGRVILWSDGATSFSGEITARGGDQGGDGGFVEVSGKSNLGFVGEVDVTATQGKTGSLLLDPSVVNIGATTTNDTELDGDNTILAGDGGAGNFNISADKIETLLIAGTDVSISASDSINLDTDGAISNPFNGGDGGLTLTAPVINLSTFQRESIDIKGDLTLNYTGNTPATLNRRLFTSGNLTLNAGGSLSITERLSSGANIQLQANSLTVGDDLFASNGISLQAQSILLNAANVQAGLQDINLNASNAIQLVNNTELRAPGNINVVSQGGILSLDSQVTATQALSLQAQTNIDAISSTLQSGADLSVTSATGNVALRGTTAAARQALQVQANQELNLTEVMTPATPLVLQSGGAMQLTGESLIAINALSQSESVFRSGGDLALISDGTITGNGRFLTKQNFVAQTTGGVPANFLYTPQNSNGIVSAAGDVSFGDYSGDSLKVEAGGSIGAGDINITDANAAVAGIDPDVATLSVSPSLILRAGLADVNTTPNRLQPDTERRNNEDLPAGFSSSPSSTNPATITTGEITIASSTTAGADAVELVAPGDITTGHIATNSGAVTLRSQTGNITVKTINTRVNSGSEGGGSVNISTDGLVRLTDQFDFTYQDPFPDFTTSPTSILTAVSGNALDGLPAPGEVRISSGGTDFVENFGTTTLKATQSGTSGLILRSSGSNASLLPAFENQIFLDSTGTVTPPNTDGGTNTGGGMGVASGGAAGSNPGAGTGSQNISSATGTANPAPSQNTVTSVNQQQANNQTCAQPTTVASAESASTGQRSGDIAATGGGACGNIVPEDDQQILQILE